MACRAVFMKELVEVEVLIEHSRHKETGLLQGLSENYIKVLTAGPAAWMNTLVRVRVERVDEKHVVGTALRRPVAV